MWNDNLCSDNNSEPVASRWLAEKTVQLITEIKHKSKLLQLYFPRALEKEFCIS
jgi:hypothetical protein